MKCHICIKEGKRSQVYSDGSTVTLMACSPYYDEDGVWHSHDFNTRTAGYHCSEGHQWVNNSTAPCPNCDYGHEPGEIIDINIPNI